MGDIKGPIIGVYFVRTDSPIRQVLLVSEMCLGEYLSAPASVMSPRFRLDFRPRLPGLLLTTESASSPDWFKETIRQSQVPWTQHFSWRGSVGREGGGTEGASVFVWFSFRSLMPSADFCLFTTLQSYWRSFNIIFPAQKLYKPFKTLLFSLQTILYRLNTPKVIIWAVSKHYDYQNDIIILYYIYIYI